MQSKKYGNDIFSSQRFTKISNHDLSAWEGEMAILTDKNPNVIMEKKTYAMLGLAVVVLLMGLVGNSVIVTVIGIGSTIGTIMYYSTNNIEQKKLELDSIRNQNRYFAPMVSENTGIQTSIRTYSPKQSNLPQKYKNTKSVEKICKICESELYPDAIFCVNCGTKI